MTASTPESSFSGGARWACVAVLGGLGAIGVGKGLVAQNQANVQSSPEPVAVTIPAQQDTQPAALSLTQAEPAPSIVAANEPGAEMKPEPAAFAEPAVGIQKLVDVNTASAAELQLLPGIGPVMASRIIEDRAANGLYRSPADLDRVKGIGPKTLEKLSPLIRFN